MKLLVTGASGFLGRRVVSAALERGHRVRALVRPARDERELPWREAPGLELVRGDLRRREGLVDALERVDAVLHLAAATAGDVYAQYEGTVVATENLLAAMHEAKVPRIVEVSSFAVYAWTSLRAGSEVDESTPLDPTPFGWSPYAHAKLSQERLIREHGERDGTAVTILRPGVIYGPGKTWTPRLGLRAGRRLWIRIGARAEVPLTHVESCADAVVLCAEHEEAIGQTFNVVDDDPPTQREYLRRLRAQDPARPRILPVPWSAARATAFLAEATNRLFFGGRAKIPEMLRRAGTHARYKPLRYSNRRLREATGWRPRYSLAEGLERSR